MAVVHEIGIGQLLKMWREKHGYTQQEASTALEISREYYCKLEHSGGNPRLKNIWPVLQDMCGIESVKECEAREDEHCHLG